MSRRLDARPLRLASVAVLCAAAAILTVACGTEATVADAPAEAPSTIDREPAIKSAEEQVPESEPAVPSTEGATDDRSALAMANAALAPFGLDCGDEPTYQETPVEPYWSVGGEAVRSVICLGDTWWGVQFSYSLEDIQPVPPAEWSFASNGPVAEDDGEYNLVGDNFVLTFGTSNAKVICGVQKRLPVRTTIAPRGAPADPCRGP